MVWVGKVFQPSDDGVASLRADYIGVVVLAAIFPLVRLTLHNLIFVPVGRYFIAGNIGQSGQRLPDKLRLKIDKFAESFWKLISYGLFTYMAYSAAAGQPWFTESSFFWRGYPNHPLSAGLARIYCAEMAFYAMSIGMLLFWETRRKDFAVMMVHHIATLILIALSYYLNFTRVGCMIMMLHDACDVLMEAAKIAKYCGAELASSIIFGLFMLTWIALRLTYFPFYIIWSTSVESTEVLGSKVPYYRLFNGLLCLLAVMHAYWFTLISKIAWRALKDGGKAEDVREDDD